jgi:predicted kinase
MTTSDLIRDALAKLAERGITSKITQHHHVRVTDSFGNIHTLAEHCTVEGVLVTLQDAVEDYDKSREIAAAANDEVLARVLFACSTSADKVRPMVIIAYQDAHDERIAAAKAATA